MKHSLLPAIIVLTTCCTNIQPDNPDVTFDVLCEGVTKSSNPGAENRISDLCIFVFDENGNSVSSKYYTSPYDISGRELFVNKTLGCGWADSFSVYIVANIGDITSEESILSSGGPSENLLQDYCYTFSDNYSEFSGKGYPMSNCYKNYSPEDTERTLYAKRLVSQYDITFSQSTENPNTYTILGGRIHDTAKKTRPFGTPYSITSSEEKISAGDLFSESDLRALNSSGSASLFIPENEQGTAFSSSTTVQEKKEENIYSSKKGLCTYVEFDVRVTTPTAVYNDVKYRFYFGDNDRDCSVHRNTTNKITFNFDNIKVQDEGWRIVPGEHELLEDALVPEYDKLNIIKGLPLSMEVRHGKNVKYSCSYDKEKAASLGVSLDCVKGEESDSYSFSTTYDACLTNPFDQKDWYKVDWEDLTINFDSDDSLIHKELTLRVVKSPIVLKWYWENGNIYCLMSRCVSWPATSTYRFKLTGKIYATNVWCSKRPLVGKNEWSCDVTYEQVNISGEQTLSSGDASEALRQTLDMNASSINKMLDRLNTGKHIHRTNNWGGNETHYSIPTWYDLQATASFSIYDPENKEYVALTDIPVVCLNDYNRAVRNGVWTRGINTNSLGMKHKNTYYPCYSAAYGYMNSENGTFESALEYPVSGGVTVGNSSYTLDCSTFDKLYFMGSERSSSSVNSSFNVRSHLEYSNAEYWN